MTLVVWFCELFFVHEDRLDVCNEDIITVADDLTRDFLVK